MKSIVGVDISQGAVDQYNAQASNQGLAPEEMKAVIRKHLKAGTVEDPEYKDAVKKYFARHICRLDPWPEAFARSLARAGEEPSVGKAM